MATSTMPDPASAGGRQSPERADPFAGLENVDGEPIADPTANPDAAFRVVWISADAKKTILVGTSEELDAAEALFSATMPGKGRVFLFEAGDDIHPLDSKGAEIERRRENEETTEPHRKLDEDTPTEDDEPEVEAEMIPGELRPGETAEQARARLAGEATEALTEVGVIDDALEEQGERSLFNASAYDDPQLKLETKDGGRIDEILVKISGSLTLDRKNADHVELFRELHRGRKVVVELRGRVAGETLEDKEKGENDVTVACRKVTISAINAIRVDGRKIRRIAYFEDNSGRTIGEALIPEIESGRLALPAGE